MFFFSVKLKYTQRKSTNPQMPVFIFKYMVHSVYMYSAIVKEGFNFTCFRVNAIKPPVECSDPNHAIFVLINAVRRVVIELICDFLGPVVYEIRVAFEPL